MRRYVGATQFVRYLGPVPTNVCRFERLGLGKSHPADDFNHGRIAELKSFLNC
jgi:hypothetical protein